MLAYSVNAGQLRRNMTKIRVKRKFDLINAFDPTSRVNWGQ